MTSFNELLQINITTTDPRAKKLSAECLLNQYNFELNGIEIDPSIQFAHNGKGCTILASKICKNVVIMQNVTIGANQTYNKETKQWEHVGNPVIGKNVVIADGAKIMGPIIIGDNSVIGMGAIITKDVPKDSIAFGVNQIKPKDKQHQPVYYEEMVDHDTTLKACEAVIERYHQL